jgi:hypothetical protein
MSEYKSDLKFFGNEELTGWQVGVNPTQSRLL